MRPFTTIADVDRIATHPVAVIRNLQITQSYHELSAAMTGRLGACANWCTFATWASKQAGNTIRGEDLSRSLQQLLANAPVLNDAMVNLVDTIMLGSSPPDKKGLRKLIWELINPQSAADRAGDAVARGNQKVYAEIGREFARFIETCLSDETYNEAHITGFCEALRAGDPPDGQRYLQQAFRRYYQAMFEPDAQAKAELSLMANIEIGFHEQTRLQPEIAEALEASVAEPHQFKLRLLGCLFPRSSWIVYFSIILQRLLGRPTTLDRAITNFFDAARRHIRIILSDHMMALGFPKAETLKLGDDLKANFPAILRQLKNPDLKAMLAQVDPTPDSMRDTGAADWADLYDRLHFIVDLFRSSHLNPDLLEPPF
ncbi:MAG: hypothetical protein IPN33_18005 [Saprospiraceae bacterium]|nr:hypothetical protein [Saprospiraceae bacterium]